MTKLILEPPRGTRDFPPAEKIVREKVISDIKEIFEIYGYSPLETPTFEKLEILEAKFGAGENSDAVSEIYRFKDQGNRDLGLRYEFTFALARFIGQNPQLKMPFKRYQIGPVFRDGPIKAGRYREFYQCDIDVVGSSFGIVDAEVLAVVRDVFKKLNLDIIIEVNDRKLLNEIILFSGIQEKQATDVIVVIDKLKKIGISGVKKELQERDISEKDTTKLLDLLTKIEKGSNSDKLKQLEKILGQTEGLKELKELFKNLETFNVKTEFNPTLARGLGYYTGPVFEVFLTDEKIMSGSLAGGGRWDKMIGKYIGNENQNITATGLAFGIEPIMEIIKARDGLKRQTVANLLIIPIGKTTDDAIKITQTLRSKGLKVIVDLSGKGVSKNIEYADKLGIPFVGFLGEDEIKQKKVKIRDMTSGKEELTDIDKVKL